MTDFDKAVEKYSDMVTGLCIVRLGNVQDAEDCWQNVFLKLYQNSDALSYDPERLKAWLIRVTVNECKNCQRFRLRHRTEALDFISEVYEDGRERLIMERVMSLPPVNREAIWLHCFAGYSVKECARLLRCKENTVKSRLKRGRDALRDLLDENEEDNNE